MTPRKPPRPDPRPDPRVDPTSLAPARPSPPEPSLTPIGVKTHSFSALAVRMDSVEGDVDELKSRVTRLEERRDSYVTLSEYPRVAKQHADTSAMEAIVKRRDSWRAVGRAIVQAMLVAALLGLFGLAWSWWTGPKPQSPPVRTDDDTRR